MAYSQGPWTTRKAKVMTDGAYDYAIIDSDGQVIAEAFGRSSQQHYHDAEANARLIAAAPELLAAMKALVTATEQRDNIGDYGVSADADEVVAARAAIAKAEGRE